MKRTLILLAVAGLACATATATLADTHTSGAGSARPGGSHHNVFVFVPTDPFFPDPFWYSDPWWPNYYNPMYYRPMYGYGPGYMHLKQAPKGQIPVELHVHPYKAFVSVDGNSMGEARDYNDSSHPLWLKPGQHTLELQHAGFKTLRVRLDVQKGTLENLHFTMNEGEGLDPRSMEIEATPEAQSGPGAGR